MQVLRKILLFRYFLFIIFLLIMLLSYYRVNFKYQSVYSENNNEFKLTVVDIKYHDNNDIVTFKGREKIVGYIKNFPFDVGDIVLIKGNLVKPKNNTIPNTFNYRKYLQSRGINWQINVCEIKEVGHSNNIFYTLKRIINNRIKNIEHNEYIYAFILGDTSYISNEIRNNYQKIGLSYLLSIGSLQIMLIVNVLNKIKLSGKKKIAIHTLIIALYIFLTGRIIGVLRSGLCYILKSILKLFKIKYHYYNLILIIGSFLLILNPFYIIDIGFIYSFSISLAISLLRNRIKGSYFRKLFLISLIAFIISLPINIYCNYEINYLSLIYSILILPIINFVIFPLCIIVFIFPHLSFILHLLTSFTEFLVFIFSKITFLSFVYRKPSMLIIFIYYFFIIMIFMKKKYALLLIVSLIIHDNINRIINEDLIIFLDVNQGDATIIKSNNHLTMIDTGGSEIYEYSDDIVKYIKSLGINKIDELFISHGDLDHIGSSYKMIDKININKVFFNNNEINDNEKILIEKLIKHNIKYEKISTLNYQINNFNYNVISYNLKTENDSSMMFLINKSKYKIILMSDATISSERLLINNYNLSKYNVLRVGHHGSKTSTSKSFYNVIMPDISIISVGKNNFYKHPNREVLNILEDSKIYRTDQDGSIMFKFKNNKLMIETFKP